MEDSGANLKCRDESVGELDVDLDRLRSLCVGAGSWLGWEFFVQGILKWLSKGGCARASRALSARVCWTRLRRD